MEKLPFCGEPSYATTIGNYRRYLIKSTLMVIIWVEDGVRTHDLRNHNPTF